MPARPVPSAVAELVPHFKEEQVFILQAFIVHSIRESGRKGVVLGLSGGVDSALVAKLCADAIGPGRVLAVAMPDGKGRKDLKDAKKFAKALGIDLRIIGIAPIVTALEKRLMAFQADQVALGNLRARARMIVLYFIANTESRVVMGTGNKSELLCGYFTLHGDGAADFLPIGDLYKTQVRDMARYLALPPDIVEKVPTAGLWPGQTDEGELGISYDELDRILLGIELQLEPEAIAQKAGVPLDHVTFVQKRVTSSVHKRKMPLVPKLGVRTIGLDWRE
jgi:NAD+ synthase